MNENNTMYNAAPVISELNKVKGFDPVSFLRRTKDGPKLDLSIKKLWFRLRYPNGKIKLSALKISDQIAIIEAKVYFDKDDKEPVSSFTSQRYSQTTPGGLYIEAAQHSAIDEALSSAGFGIQFIPAAQKAETYAEDEFDYQSIIEKTTETRAKDSAVTETIPEPDKPDITEKAEVPVEQESVTPAQNEEAAAKSAVEEIPEQADITEIREEECQLPYTKDMPVEEICALMSIEEAEKIVVPVGTCKGWTLAQVADRRPVSLKWYLTGYSGDDNILRAGAKIIQSSIESRAA